MKWAKGAFLVGDLTLSPPLQPPDSDPRPLEGSSGSIGPRTAHPGGVELGLEELPQHRKGNIPEEIAPRSASRRSAHAAACVCLFVCRCCVRVCVADDGGGGVTLQQCYCLIVCCYH